jgi:hypothetical protein
MGAETNHGTSGPSDAKATKGVILAVSEAGYNQLPVKVDHA